MMASKVIKGIVGNRFKSPSENRSTRGGRSLTRAQYVSLHHTACDLQTAVWTEEALADCSIRTFTLLMYVHL